MEELEIKGKSIEEAIQRALKQLGVTREQVEVTVLSEGRPGLWGIGAEEARIRVSRLEPAPDGQDETAEAARAILEKLLAGMGIEAAVVAESGSMVDEETENTPIVFDIKGDDLGILIGRRGQTMTALQYIVRLILLHEGKTSSPVIIDVEGYKQRRYDSLRALAQRVAEQVLTRRAPISLRPMPAFERRIIHLALADHPGVSTESTGVEPARKVVISPRGNRR